FYTFYKDINLINKQIDIYRSITREDIQRVAKKYLSANQRLDLDYLPENAKQ
ncbi:insulinase family protein, partial [Shigella flexneri]|nr:insulinase family protein [Shigella flexneri]